MEIGIHVDRGRCIGSGQCVHWAPGAFDQDDDAISVVTDPKGEPGEKIIKAVTTCPVQAISLQVGEAKVTADDFTDWMQGTTSEHPLVPQLIQLGDEHHELFTRLNGSGPDAGQGLLDEIVTETRAHLQAEDGVYAAIAELVDPPVIEAFRQGHDKIEAALARLLDESLDEAERDQLTSEVVALVAAHVEAEENVLFPMALARLAHEPADAKGR